ncbi:MAG: pyruvate ferredoxin oxidoreductase [Thermoplasmata archaeon]|nr:pyruvate ferredoxin oxidoreductase [Thermoplasmata archaeon]
MPKRVVTGNYAAAWAAMRSKVQVVAAYPITPQTFIVEHISEFVNDGIMDAQFIEVESEHTAMSATVSASAAGVRAFTATSSQGLALMHEILFTASGLRVPIVMAVVNRTLSAPLNIWCEHNDIMPERDSGWLIMFCENNQEVHDMVIQGFKIAENEKVQLPLCVNLDAFILSHSVEPVDLADEKPVEDFLGKYIPKSSVLDPEKPMAVGHAAPPDYMMESRWLLHDALEKSKDVIRDVNDDFAKKFGRDYKGLIEEYRTDDADVVLMTVGTVTGTAREVVDSYRKQGKKVGLVKLRFLRPYPTDEVRKVVSKVKAFGVYDRAVSFGVSGPQYIEAKSALYGLTIPTVNFIAGLGGRDVTTNDIEKMFDALLDVAKTGKVKKNVVWINTRGVSEW